MKVGLIDNREIYSSLLKIFNLYQLWDHQEEEEQKFLIEYKLSLML